MSKKITRTEAVGRLHTVHPNVELVVFEGASKPCTVRCAEHGEQEWAAYSEAVRSRTGCPKCGTLLRHKEAGQRFKKRADDYQYLRRRVEQLETLLTNHGITLPETR